jgi:hypothetical protein
LCEQAGFKGHFTNHSLQATAATRFYDAGLDKQLIAEKNGHRSSAIRLYKRTQNTQLKKCSDIIQGREHTEDDKYNTKKRRCEELSEPQGTVREIQFQQGNTIFKVKF